MRGDVTRWIRACLTCASRQPGRAAKAPLTPIPVGGVFDRVGVDVITFPTSYDGNKYAVVFVDYLSKWPEVFAVPDQTTHTAASGTRYQQTWSSSRIAVRSRTKLPLWTDE